MGQSGAGNMASRRRKSSRYKGFTVIGGSVRSDRQGLEAAKFVERTLAARGHDVTIVDPARSW